MSVLQLVPMDLLLTCTNTMAMLPFIVSMSVVLLALPFAERYGLQGCSASLLTLQIYPVLTERGAARLMLLMPASLPVTTGAGLLQGVHVPSEKSQKQRSIIRFRKKLWADLVRAKNRLKSELKFQGIEVPAKFDNPHWSHNFINWIEQQANNDEDLKDTLLLMPEEVQALRLLLLKTERRLRELMWSADYKEKSELLRTIPGVGPLTAMLFLLEAGDVRRFKTFDALNRFVGLCPDSDSSGESEKHTGISVRRHKTLRSALVESAWQLIGTDAAMFNHYKELTKRMKPQKAIIRITRKLLRRMRAVMLSGKAYVKGVDGNLSGE